MLAGHLIHRFGLTETDWHRIKQNIDSKCRTAFRRRVRGLPLTVKAFRGKAPPTYIHMANEHGGHDMSGIEMGSDDSLNDDSELHIHHVYPIVYFILVFFFKVKVAQWHSKHISPRFWKGHKKDLHKIICHGHAHLYTGM